MTTVLIDGVDRTQQIRFDSLSINNIINQRVDTCSFRLKYKGWRPQVTDEIVIEDDNGDRIFGGYLVRVNEQQHSLGLMYQIECKDYTQDFNRLLVLERYRNVTVDYILNDLLAKYAPGFTLESPAITTVVKSITFNRITLTQAIEKLAGRLNNYWYIDYYKGLHFFASSGESAPFGITDTTNAIKDTLELEKDVSQLRNKIYIKGGEEEGNELTETHTAPTNDQDRLYIRLANKFASMPVVTVDGLPITVGVENLDDETAFDAMWSYQQKYIRFKDTTIPDAGAIEEVTGIPLYPILITRSNAASITEYGKQEFAIIDPSIRSREEALQLGNAQLKAHKDGIKEGSFATYEPGLVAGMRININSVLRDIDEDYVVQSVKTKIVQTQVTYFVEIATAKTLGIIEFLQGLLLKEQVDDGDVETLIDLVEFDDGFSVTDDEPVFTSIDASGGYTWEADVGSTQPNPIVWNEFTWSA